MALTSVADALARILSATEVAAGVETVPLAAALGRYAAADIDSPIDVPPWANSAMDGYALRAADLAEGRALPVAQRIAAGQAGMPLLPGTAARIFTGAPLPPGADTVVIQEDCRLVDGAVRVETTIGVGANVRPQGDDIRRGSRLLSRGDRLGAAQVALLASAGIAQLALWRPLRVAIFSTGDELVEPGQLLAPGQIYNANRPLLTGLLLQAGFDVIDCGIVPDTAAATEAALRQAADQADCVISSGGVSAGEEDHVRATLQRIGELTLWKLAIKPGKPLAFGQIGDTPFFGLPGNPASAFVTFQLLARPFLLKRQGAAQWSLPRWRLPAAFSWPKPGSRQEYLRARLQPGDGGLAVDIYPNQSSGVLASVAWADALVEIPPGTTVAPGQVVEVLRLG
jgi:molybdopterin molybdotransferase